MAHDCTQDVLIRLLTSRVDRLEVMSETYQKDLAEIKKFQGKLLWGMIGVLLTSSGTLLLLIFKMKGVG